MAAPGAQTALDRPRTLSATSAIDRRLYAPESRIGPSTAAANSDELATANSQARTRMSAKQLKKSD